MVRGGFSLASFRTDQREPDRIAGRQFCADQAFPWEFWRFFSRIAFCSFCTILPLRFVQVYKVCYLCKMLLTIYRNCAKIQTVRDTERTETAGRPGGRAQRRNGPHPGEGKRTWRPDTPDENRLAAQRRRNSLGAECLTVEQWDALKVENKTV